MSKETCKITRWQLLKQQLNNLSPEEFMSGIRNNEDVIVLDVRTDQEYQSGRPIPGSRHLNYLGYAFLDQLEALEKDSAYFVYCRTGRRSVRTCTLMKNSGFSNVFHLDGGLLALEEYFGKGE